MVAQPDILGQATKTQKFLPRGRNGFALKGIIVLVLISFFSPTAARAAFVSAAPAAPPAVAAAGFYSTLTSGLGGSMFQVAAPSMSCDGVFLSTPYTDRNGPHYSVPAAPPSAARTFLDLQMPALQGPGFLRWTGPVSPSLLNSSHRDFADVSLPAGTASSTVPAYLLPGAILAGLVAAMIWILARAYRETTGRTGPVCGVEECLYNIEGDCIADEETRLRCRKSYGSTLDVEEIDGEEEEAENGA
jgi:hypothetical protein